MSAIPAPDEGALDYTGTIRATAQDRRLGLALVVIATAQLMVVLDATIVNVALPHIPRALGFSGSGLSWVVNAYAVTFGGLMLLGGRRPCRSDRRGSGWPGRSCTPRRTVATPRGEDGFRVWFIINEITDGNWASA